ncbi:MAG: TonB family protein [Gammaproteobacteria bacterium]|nr:TonB family protein [Gammaproteobacteria bacterium]
MSVEASETLSEVWTRWQGHVINGEFRLGRCLGCSDHSGVYLTRSAALGGADLAIKLVATNRALAEQLLPRWKRAGALAHPHLLQLLAWGGCQLEGLPYLYLVMEYADQTLAQLLAHRALAPEEARQLLEPSLEALAFLHGQGLVQGQLKPANILVVGEHLKLASDTIRRVGEGAISTHALTAYDPPEGRQGNTSPAGDVWALGVTLFEALTRRLPAVTGEPREAPAPPAELAQDLRELVIGCLSADPRRRPSVPDLMRQKAAPQAGALPEATAAPSPPVAAEVPAAPAAPATPATAAPPVIAEPITAEPAVTAEPAATAKPAATVEHAMTVPPDTGEPPARPRIPHLALIGAVAAIAGIFVLSRWANHSSAPATPVNVPAGVAAQAPASTAPGAVSPVAQAARSEAVAAPVALQQVIPQVPLSARRTIHGHIKVWVRVIVDADGSVFAAVADRSGPSRYFQRLAVEAARKWTFPPAAGPARRILQVQFDFSRDGTTGRARPVIVPG